MAHPSLSQKQATIVNIVALGTIAALVLAGLVASTSEESTQVGAATSVSPSTKIGLIDTKRIMAADEAPGDWLSYGRDYGEQRFSPLTQVNKQSIEDLELAWSFDMFTNRGLEASPIVVDGIMYMTGSWSVVFAVDAKTGEEIWSYDPEVPGDWARKACCDVVNRGVAVYEGAVYIATLDGYLVSLNAETGEVIWQVSNAVPFSNAPTIRGGRLYVVSRDSRLQVVSTQDGSRLWEHLAITELATVIGATSPAVDSRMVVAGFNSGEIVALNSINGRVAWTDSLTSRSTQITPLSELNAIVGRPVIDGDRVFAVSHGGRMVSIDMRTGERIWTADIGSIETPWVLGDFIFVVTLDGQVVCLSSGQGRVRWVSQLPAFEDPDDREGRINWTGPILASGKIYVASSTGELLALDPETGAIETRVDLDEPINVPPVIADGTIYFLADDGSLIARR